MEATQIAIKTCTKLLGNSARPAGAPQDSSPATFLTAHERSILGLAVQVQHRHGRCAFCLLAATLPPRLLRSAPPGACDRDQTALWTRPS